MPTTSDAYSEADVIDDAPRTDASSAAATATTTSAAPPSATLGGEQKRSLEQLALLLFITVPFLALVAAVPLVWGWGVSWLDLGLLVFMYYLGCHGITIGFHRYFTHGSFKAKRPLRIALAVAGSMAVEGPSSAGWRTTASTTSSRTRRATRTPRGASARRFRP